MASETVNKTLRQYQQLQSGLRRRLDQLEKTASTNQLSYQSDVTTSKEMHRQTQRTTQILGKILDAKLQFIDDMIGKLKVLKMENPRQQTPYECQVARFHDWVETNQELFVLDEGLYETQKVKFDMEQPHRHSQPHPQHSSLVPGITSTSTVSPDMTLGSSVPQLQVALNRFSSAMPTDMKLYITDRLQPRDSHMTFEATKVQEFIRECEDYHALGTLEDPPRDSQGTYIELCIYITLFIVR